MSDKDTSKFISLILRHKPETIGITLDEHGWADVSELITGINKTHKLDMEGLERIVAEDEKQRYSDFDNVVIAPPFGWTNSFWLVSVKAELCDEETVKLLPEETHLSFPLLTAVTRAVYDYMEEEKIRQEKDWFLYDTFLHNYFERSGCHLTAKVPKEKYDEFVLYCLDHHIIINPHYEGTSYVPYQVDKGNFSQIKNSPFAF